MRRMNPLFSARLALGVVAGLAAASLCAGPAWAASPQTSAQTSAQAGAAAAVASSALAQRVQALLRDSDAYWAGEFRVLKSIYRPPALRLFNGTIGGTCGAAGILTGPFYCPDDEYIYLDESFLRQAVQRAAGAGDVALAYILAHEVGHHVQGIVGTTAQVEQARSRSSPQLSARIWMTEELQADCFGGLWVRAALMQRQIAASATRASASASVGAGVDAEVAAALQAVAAVSQQRVAHLPATQVMPDPLQTYGSAAQRLKWFERGLTSGNFADCDTFSAAAAGQL